MIAKNTKVASTRHHTQDYHNSYGIQNWLCRKGFCLAPGAKYKVDESQYQELLRAFVIHVNPEFDFSRAKGIKTLERIVQQRFPAFCSFAVRYFQNPRPAEPGTQR